MPFARRLLRSAVLPSAVLLCAAAARAEIELPDVLPAPSPAPAARPGQPAAAPAPAADPFGDHALFGDHDRFHGRFVAFSAKDGVTWRRKDCAADFTFRPDALDALVLRPAAPKPPAAGDVTLLFNNGDAVSGKLVACAPDKTAVETAWGGRLEFETKALRSLVPARSMPLIVNGVGQLGDWQFFNGNPQDGSIANGALTIINSTGAGRTLPLPPKFRLEMEMDTRQSNGASFVLLASPINNGNQPRDGYFFWLPGRNNGNQGNAGSPNGPRRGFPCTAADVYKIAVFVDTEAKSVTLVVNGKKVWTHVETGAFPKGKTLAFPASGTVKASKLAVYGNGVFSEGGEGKPPATDTVTFVNGDKVQGSLLSIQGGKVSFKSEFAAMEAPLDRVERMEFSSKCDLSPKHAAGDVRVEIGENDRLTLHAEAVKDGALTGKSPVFGACSVRQDALRRIQFNLDAPFRAKAAEEGEAGEDQE